MSYRGARRPRFRSASAIWERPLGRTLVERSPLVRLLSSLLVAQLLTLFAGGPRAFAAASPTSGSTPTPVPLSTSVFTASPTGHGTKSVAASSARATPPAHAGTAATAFPTPAHQPAPRLVATMAGSTTGSVLDWGDNTYGELGNGTTTSTYNPVTVSNLTGVTAIATSGYSSLARKADGTVWA